eukprot:COSAG02_NODE_428_length_22489_cov_4.690219_9_plen_51_part_00
MFIKGRFTTVLKWRQEMPPMDLNLPQKRDLHAKPLRYHSNHLEPSYEVVS